MKFTVNLMTALTFFAVLLLRPGIASAQTKEEFQELKKQLKALQEKTAQLEKRLATAEPKPSAKASGASKSSGEPGKAVAEVREAALVTADENGFVIKSADDRFKLRIGGLIQFDGRFFAEDDHRDNATDTFLLRRVRPILEGKIFDDFGFRLMPDFGQGTTVLYDAYIEYTHYEAAQLRVGKFKEPVGLERLQSASDLLFVERGLPTNLVPNRDVGAQLSGAFLDKIVNYQLGIFNGVPDGANGDLDNNDDKDFAGRIWLQPFKKLSIPPLKGWNIGVAGTYGEQNGALPSYKTPGQQTFFSYTTGTLADGDRWRIAPQTYYSWGPFGLLAEYVRSQQEIRNAGIVGEGGAEAWQVVASYVLTGEDASFKGVKPRKNFGAGGWGSLEIMARYGQLNVDSEPFRLGLASITKSARSADSFGVGLSWNLNRNVRMLLDYDHTTFDGGAVDGDRPDENVVMTRVQLAF